MSASIRLLVVDDHTLFRRGLVALLASEPGLQVVGEAGDAGEALLRARELQPQVILLDNHLPGASGVASLTVSISTCAEGAASFKPGSEATPLAPGRWLSSRMTCGCSSRARNSASPASAASPTTCRPGSLASSATSPRRNSVWSSTTSRRIGALMPDSRPRAPTHRAPPSRRLEDAPPKPAA